MQHVSKNRKSLPHEDFRRHSSEFDFGSHNEGKNSPKIDRAFDSVVVVVEASAPKVYPRVTRERQHPFRVDGKGLEGWRRTSKYVLPSCIHPGAPHSQSSIVCGSYLQRGHRGSAEGSMRLA